MKFSWKISRYILSSVQAYFVFSWLLLSVILFVQQGSKFTEIFFSTSLPSFLIWQLAAALVPNVIAFTAPMAVLVGVIIGLSKMQGDSELVAIRAAGLGNAQILLPLFLLGLALSVFTVLINLFGVPAAASVVKSVGLRSALYKLESPIEPATFNSEIAGYTIYVRSGDLETGEWRQIFIYNEDKANDAVRLITSSRGRIDSNQSVSELVLDDAMVTSYSLTDEQTKYTVEQIGDFRFAIKTRREELIERLNSSEPVPEELGLRELAAYAAGKEGSERTEAEILWQRRVLLSIAPLIFTILGGSLILRFNRGGRGFGILMALITLIGFYLMTFLGEQLARTERLSVLVSGLIPIVGSILLILWFNFGYRLDIFSKIGNWFRSAVPTVKRGGRGKVARRDLLMDLTTGLRDFELLANLARYFALTILFLAAVFLIFTAFELWRFAGTMDGGFTLLIRYLVYLMPFVYLQLAPSAAMIAVLATYVIKSRQNEIVTWTAAGQSIYRLLVPAFIFTLVVGIVNWQIEDNIAYRTNQIQDELRNRLRSRGVAKTVDGRVWLAEGSKIVTYVKNTGASDNEIVGAADCSAGCAVKNVEALEFGGNNEKLQALYRISSGVVGKEGIRASGAGTRTVFGNGDLREERLNDDFLLTLNDAGADIGKRSSQMTISDVRSLLRNTASEVEQRILGVALQKKYTTFIVPFVIALFTAPFALSLDRKGKVVTVGYAVGLWLIFVGTSAVFEQFGQNGLLPPAIAVWAPLFLFTMFGLFLLSRVRT